MQSFFLRPLGAGRRTPARSVLLNGSSQYLRRLSPSGISLGSSHNLLFGAWVRFTNLTNASSTMQVVLSQSDLTGDQRSWQFRGQRDIGNPVDRFAIVMSSNGLAATNTLLEFSPPSAMAAATWYFILGGWDASGEVIRGRAGSVASAGSAATPVAFVGGPLNASAGLRIGAVDSSEQWNFNGRVQRAFVANPPSLGASTFDDLFTLLRNSGVGLRYDDLTASDRSALEVRSWFELNEVGASEERRDSAGSNHLTPFGSPTFANPVPT